MKCQLCKEDVFLPYRCKYCGQYFCDDHRLPEKHRCPSLPKRTWGKQLKPQQNHTTSKRTKIDSPPHVKQPLRMKEKETLRTPRRNALIQKIGRIKYSSIVSNILNIAFLIVISLPVLDSIQLMWDSPTTFSRTFLPKWWDLFPSEYPVPSINLLLVYVVMFIVFGYTVGLFVSKLRYKKYDPRHIKIRHYIYIITVGSIFLYFFSEARLFWINSLIYSIKRLNGG